MQRRHEQTQIGSALMRTPDHEAKSIETAHCGVGIVEAIHESRWHEPDIPAPVHDVVAKHPAVSAALANDFVLRVPDAHAAAIEGWRLGLPAQRRDGLV